MRKSQSKQNPDEDDPYIRETPISREELLELRKKILLELGNYGVTIVVPSEFTCDSCKLAPKCKLVFDPYNTGGDCLLGK
jgi:hypothetical protein